MSDFFDAIFLARFNPQNGAHILKFYPQDFDFLNQNNIFSICSFPETQSDSSINHDESKTSTVIYATTIENKNCYILSFLYKSEINNINEPNSIVIVSQKLIAAEIFKMLLDTRTFLLRLIKENEIQVAKMVNDSNTNNNTNKNAKKSIPEIVLDEIWKCIQACTFDCRNTLLTIVTPIRKFNVFLSTKHITYSQFDPYFWLNFQSNLYVIWHALMTNRGILIIGDSPSQVSCAVFSIISLASPLKYCESYIAYTRLGDPRFAEIITNQSRKWKIVGTTNPLLAERCKQFGVIGKLSPIKDDKLKEIDPDLLQQKFLIGSKSIDKNYEEKKRNINNSNSNSSIWRKLDFLGLKNFNNKMNSTFSLQLKGAHSTDSSQSSLCSSIEDISRSMYPKSFKSATRKMMALIEFRLNTKIEYDSYFDVLSKELQEEDFYGIFVQSSDTKNKSNSKEIKKSLENGNNSIKPSTSNFNKFKLGHITNSSKSNLNHQNKTNSTNLNNSLENDNESNGISLTLSRGSLNDGNDDVDDDGIENVLFLNFHKNGIDDMKQKGSKNSDNDDDDDDDEPSENDCTNSDENNPNLISNEFLNRKANKIKSISVMKHKNLFNSHLLSERASKISSFYINKYKKKKPKIKFFTIKDALMMQNTFTFKDWRKTITYRSRFRECFLSNTPYDTLKGRSRDELIKIYELLNSVIAEKYKRDLHMATVIKKHIRIIKKLIDLDEEVKKNE